MDTQTTTRQIVVGTDGTNAATRAVLWSVRTAAAARLPLTIVHVDPDRAPEPGGIEAQTGKILDRAIALAHDHGPEVRTTADVRAGDVVSGLLAAAAGAELLVVGMAGHDDPVEARGASAALDIAGRARCPVVVVRDEFGRPNGPVVAGIRDPETDHPVLQAAFALARDHHTTMIVVHTHSGRPTDRGCHPPNASSCPEIERAVASWEATFPDVDHDVCVNPWPPAEELVERAGHALVVVLGGCTREGDNPSLPSTTMDVIHSGPCPVVVVPRDARTR